MHLLMAPERCILLSLGALNIYIQLHPVVSASFQIFPSCLLFSIMDHPSDDVLLRRILVFIGFDTARRFQCVAGPLSFLCLSNNNIIPCALAKDKLLPNEIFYARPAHDAFTFADVQAENGLLSETGYFEFAEWATRGLGNL